MDLTRIIHEFIYCEAKWPEPVALRPNICARQHFYYQKLTMNIADLNKDGIGLDGLDPVAYAQGEPLRGTPEFRATVDKVTFHFANADNLDAFNEDPGKYLSTLLNSSPEKMVGDINDADDSGRYVGDRTHNPTRSLEDAVEGSEEDVPNDLKEDGDWEMQNLSDSDK